MEYVFKRMVPLMRKPRYAKNNVKRNVFSIVLLKRRGDISHLSKHLCSSKRRSCSGRRFGSDVEPFWGSILEHFFWKLAVVFWTCFSVSFLAPSSQAQKGYEGHSMYPARANWGGPGLPLLGSKSLRSKHLRC